MRFLRCIWSIVYRLFFVFRIDNNKVLFTSFYGKGYGDSPKYIAEILKEYNFKLYWTINASCMDEFPPYILPLKKNRINWLYHMATSGVWIDNCRKQRWISKRSKQFYIQTWHGGICLKKIEMDAMGTLQKEYIEAAQHDSKMINAFISASSYQTELIKKSFWYNGDIIETGLPRSDIFYNNTKETRRKVCDCFGIDYNDGIILYAPTFRNSNNLSVYNLDSDRIIRVCEEKWDSRYRMIIRLHPNVSNECKQFSYNKSVINGSYYPDSNELICASDVIITDYSSIMFEALENSSIVFLYASDLSSYINERDGFYFSFDELPFDFAETNNQLEKCIRNFDYKRYKLETDTFQNRIKSFNDGFASKRVVEYILEQRKQAL